MDDRQAKIEAMRADLAAHPEMLARFNEIHPPMPAGPTSLEDALRGLATSAQASTHIPGASSPWYDQCLQVVTEIRWRTAFAVPCAVEAKMLCTSCRCI